MEMIYMADYVSSDHSLVFIKQADNSLKLVGYKQTSNEVTFNRELVANNGIGDEWEEVVPGRKGATGSTEMIENFPDLEEGSFETLLDAWNDGDKLVFRKMIGLTKFIDIPAFIESVSANASENAMATGNLSWKMSGAYTKGTLPEVPVA
jgi:hypothetical protein